MKEALVRLLDGAVSANKTAVTEKDYKRELKVILQEAHRIGVQDGRQEEFERSQARQKESDAHRVELEEKIKGIRLELEDLRAENESLRAESRRQAQSPHQEGGEGPAQPEHERQSQKGLGDAPRKRERLSPGDNAASQKAAADAAKRL